MRTTESIAARVSEAVTKVDQTIPTPLWSRMVSPDGSSGTRQPSVDRPDRGLTLPDDAQEPLGPLDRFVLVPYLHERPSTDELLGLSERPVGDGELPVRVGDLRALCARAQPTGGQQHTSLR